MKEESSYRTELVAQEKRIEGLETGMGTGDGDAEEDGNREFSLRQEVSIIYVFILDLG